MDLPVHFLFELCTRHLNQKSNPNPKSKEMAGPTEESSCFCLHGAGSL